MFLALVSSLVVLQQGWFRQKWHCGKWTLFNFDRFWIAIHAFYWHWRPCWIAFLISFWNNILPFSSSASTLYKSILNFETVHVYGIPWIYDTWLASEKKEKKNDLTDGRRKRNWTVQELSWQKIICGLFLTFYKQLNIVSITSFVPNLNLLTYLPDI